MVITLQHVLETTVAGKLGANPAGEGKRQTITLERHQQGGQTGDKGTHDIYTFRPPWPSFSARNVPCSPHYWAFDHAVPSAKNTIPAVLCLAPDQAGFMLWVSAGSEDLLSKSGHSPLLVLCSSRIIRQLSDYL